MLTLGYAVSSSLKSLLFILCLFTPLTILASPIQFAGKTTELVISQASERTLRIQLTPLDEQGQPLAYPSSTVLVPFATSEKFRSRDLAQSKEWRVGALRIHLQPQPLGISISRADGCVIQELTF